MTSKYEDALNDLNKLKKIASQSRYELPQQCEAWFDRHIDLTEEALRKAESMDRLIEEIDKGFFFTVKVKDKLVEINPVF